MSKTLYRAIKRIFDIIFALIFLAIFSPLILLICIIIYLNDKGEIFVKDPLRIGLKGKEFRMYKFRTMIPNAHEAIKSDPKYAKLKEEWEKPGRKLTIDEDIRITKIGKILRKTDLDELPQLINVLKGDMSIVGPRPMYIEELEKHFRYRPVDRKHLENIKKTRPGITGIWQVSGRNNISFEKRLKMDSIYSQNINILEDLDILVKTPYVVLTRKGAHE